MINPLECPHCKKKAANFWEIFVFPSPLYINYKCKYCHNLIKFNGNVIYKVIPALLLIGIVFVNFFEWLFSFNLPFIVGILIVFLFIAIPFICGAKIFRKPP